MKKNILIVLGIILSLSLKSFGQKLEENKTDEFTKQSVKRTSWETLSSKLSETSYCRVSLVGDRAAFDLKMMLYKVFSINEGKEIMLKLDNGDIVTIQNVSFAVTCNGCGATGFAGSHAEGLQTSYLLSKDQVEKLKAHKIAKIRIATDDGYLDEEVKDKNATKIMACFNLI